MITGRPLLVFGAGLVAGIACVSIAGFVGVFSPSEPESKPERESPLLADVASAFPREIRASRPRIDVEHGGTLDRAGALTRNLTREGVLRLETRPDVVAIQVWESNGFTGQGAVLRFGPERKDLYVRVYSTGDAGPSTSTWERLEGRIQIPEWPLVPDAVVGFEFRGIVDEIEQSFAGKFLIPAARSREELARASDARIRVITNTAMDSTPSLSESRAAGSVATIERIPARPELQAFRYMESHDFGGVQATFSFGPGPEEVQVRVDDLSDAGPPEAWHALQGTIWLSSVPLDRPGSIVEFELFGLHTGQPRRFAAKFVTPP